MFKAGLKVLPYSLSYLIPILVFISITERGLFSFLTPFVIFIILPLIEWAVGKSEKNFSTNEEVLLNKNLFYSILLYGHTISVYFGLFIFLQTISTHNLKTYELIGVVLSMGTLSGGVGITVAHELFHRSKLFEKLLGKFLLLSSCYMHYSLEHVYGHHKNVGKMEDPASARFGESIYKFLPRTIVGTYLSAWNIELKILNKKKFHFFSFKNEMLLFHLITFSFIFFILIVFGLISTVAFLVASLISVIHLEVVNYIEHYGLQRKFSNQNGYEKIGMEHSWSSNNYISRWFLYELNRHSDHHLNASKKYQTLRHIENSPQHPAGYPAMMLLALVPFLWKKVMNKKVEEIIKLS